jgi:hypothetical protein
MSHTGGEAIGAALALRLSVAAVFWLCGIVHLQRLVFGKDEICDLERPLDGMHLAMAAYMAFMFCPGYSRATDRPAAAAFLVMTAALAVRAVRHGSDGGKAPRCAMTATGGAGMAYMLLTDPGNGNAVGVALALLLAACTAAHLCQLTRTLRRRMGTGSQSPLVRGGQVASAVITTGMVIMLLQM